MKKSLLAITAVLSIGQAFAQTTSSTTISTSGMDNFIKNSKVDYYGALYKDDQGKASGTTTQYHELTGSYTYGPGRVYIRPRFEGVDGAAKTEAGDEVGTEIKALNPRMGIRPFSFSSGIYSLSTEARLELATTWGDERLDTDQFYGVGRIAATNSFAISKAVTASVFAGLYENILRSDALENGATEDIANTNLFLVDYAVNYAINDKHSLLLNFETYNYLNEAVIARGAAGDAVTHNNAHNVFYLRYTNSSIKGLDLTPGVYMNTQEDVIAENLGVQLELTYTLL